MRRLPRVLRSAFALAAFLFVAGLLTWPLPLHLTTHLLGDPTGDTGVYVWNVWIFRHEILRHGHLPVSTDHIFSFTGGADFALHNYTPVAGLLGAPLIGLIGIVATYNVIMLVLIALTGASTVLLARELGLGRVASWVGAVLFIASPVLTARQTAHLSLVIAAPLPLFLYALLRTLRTERLRDAAAVGVICAVASYSDAYYGIYCVLIGLFVVAWRFARIEQLPRFRQPVALIRVLYAGVAVFGAVIAFRLVTGVMSVTIGSVRVDLDPLHTPVLAIVVLLSIRAWIAWRPVIRWHDPDHRVRKLTRHGLVAVAVCSLLLSPVLAGVALRFLNDRLPTTEIYWRSSPRGVDLLSYLVPNPNHAWFGRVTQRWLLPANDDAFPELVGSFSLVALAVIAVSAARRQLPARWLAFTAFFVALSLGPFVHIGGVNTYIPGPWTFLRYVPLVGLARSPSRFAIVAVLGMSVLFAFAVDGWMRTRRQAPGGLLMAQVVASLMVFELMAVPRPLYSAAVPDVYQMIATNDDESGRLLELPTGVRDGTSSLGDFNASTQYFQTRHRRRLIGGYLSRVSRWRRTENLRAPILRALFRLSEGGTVSDQWRQEAAASRDAFLARSCVRFVVVNKHRATPALKAFAIETLNLTPLHEDDVYELLVPISPPPCSAAASARDQAAVAAGVK